jgi:dipeptidyl aminopeptidase/acylaminoacyl peptidase
VSSYWGKGYWEYLYSQVASAPDFPWNKKDSETNQSPLTGADGMTTSVLLLHDNEAANAPSDESRPFYTALKKQNREVELKEIDKDQQQTIDDHQKILWQKTIISWFDKNLKNQPDWWNHLYPKKN